MQPPKLGAHGIGGINASGQVPKISGNFGLIDPDTPSSALHYTTYKDQTTWDLVFSDEFNVENRTFYPVSTIQLFKIVTCVTLVSLQGDDPYWEAVDLNYWSAPHY
jgi:hypothetical protein